MKNRATIAMCLACVTFTLSGEAGKANKFVVTKDYGDGFLRVQKSKSDVSFSQFRQPRLWGNTSCSVDGYRVMKVGNKDAKPYNKTSVSHNWLVDPKKVTLSDAPASLKNSRKAKLAAACTAGHSAVRIPLQESGACLCNKSAFCGGKVDVKSTTRWIPFAMECMGYTRTKKPLFLFKHKNNVSGRGVWVYNADAGGDLMLKSREAKNHPRVRVEAQIWAGPGSGGRRALYKWSMTAPDGVRETLAAHPKTTSFLQGRGYKRGARVGFIDTAAGSGRTALYLYFNAKTQDVATVASTQSVNGLESQGYKLVREEGFVQVIPNL